LGKRPERAPRARSSALEVCVEELLARARWCRVGFEVGRQQCELGAKGVAQLVQVEAPDRKATALGWAVRTERRDHELAVGCQRSMQRRKVSEPVIGIDHEVEHGAVVQKREGAAEVVAADVSLDPLDPSSVLPKRRLRVLERSGRYVGDG